jgi:tetratricopeptide (TPR) repeat protein
MSKPSGLGQSAFAQKRLVTLGLGLLLLVMTVAVYAPVHNQPFANIDDGVYVTENTHIQGGLNVNSAIWAFTTWHGLNWHPLTWVAHALSCQFFGLDPAGHHDVNLFLHALNVLLLLWVLTRATGYVGRSFMVAGLFALHPLNVEVVAWIAELKTLLSTVFFLLALGAYRWYASRPGISRYVTVAALFGLGLMAKPQVIALPFVLLLWDYWPLRRMFASYEPMPLPAGAPEPCPRRSFTALLWEKVPLLFMCAVSAVLTMVAQGQARPSSWKYSLWMRLGNAFLAYGRYIRKGFWPSDLALQYPYVKDTIWHWETYAALALLLAVSAFVVVYRRHRYLVVGWLWFLVTLVPMIGIIQVGLQSMADRYAYDSFLGLFLMLCWGVPDWAERRRIPVAAVGGLGVAALLALSVVTYRQVNYWKDPFIMWTHAQQVVKNHWEAEDNLGVLLLAQGREEEAMGHFWRAVAISPQDATSNLRIAIYEQEHGEWEEAIARYKLAYGGTFERQDQVKICTNIALCYRDMGDRPKALEWLQKAQEVRDAPVPHGFLHRD